MAQNDDISRLNHEATRAILALRKIAGYKVLRRRIKLRKEQITRFRNLKPDSAHILQPPPKESYAKEALQCLADLANQKDPGRKQTEREKAWRAFELHSQGRNGKTGKKLSWPQIADILNTEFSPDPPKNSEAWRK